MYNLAIETLLSTPNAKSVSVYTAWNRVIKVTYHNKPKARNRYNCFSMTIGVPNYLGTRYVKKCIKLNCPYLNIPVVKLYPPKKKKA